MRPTLAEQQAHMEELAARDAAERERIRRVVIANEERALYQARVRRARTDAIERRLAELNAARCRHHFDDERCWENTIPGEYFCAEHYIATQPAEVRR